MLNAIVVDDEIHNVETVKILLGEFCPDVHVIGTAHDGKSALAAINQLQPDLVFLDVEMPHGNGFDVLEKLAPVNFEIIFITAYDRYAIRAFEYAALDYLLKPVSADLLQKAVERARNRVKGKSMTERVEVLIRNMRNTATGVKRMAIPTAEGLIFEDFTNISRLEAEGSYSWLYPVTGKKMLVTRTLKEFEDLLPPESFCRVHHSHIINLSQVKKYFKGRGGYVEMADGSTVEVSTRKKDEFLEKFGV